MNDKSIPCFYGSTSCQSMSISNLLNSDLDNSNLNDDISGFDFNNDEPGPNEENFSLTDAALEVAQLSQLVNLKQETNESE